MSLDEFIRQSAPGGHLISAELCATGLVGTILHAGELGGQEVDYTVGLSLLGLTLTGERPEEEPRPALSSERIAPELAARALGLNRQVEEIVRTNIREYEEQNMLVRPVVKRMFQQGTGLKVEEWLAQAQAMTSRLERAVKDVRAGQMALDLASVESYLDRLRRMVDYITRQEGTRAAGSGTPCNCKQRSRRYVSARRRFRAWCASWPRCNSRQREAPYEIRTKRFA